MVDCLEYAVNKENELPKIIDMVLSKIFKVNNSDIPTYNKKMRTAKDILKDYGLDMEV